jgi:hypothetical protein
LAKAALVASAKAVLRTSAAAQSASFLVANIAVSFLIGLSCSPPIATVKQRSAIAMLKQIV